MAQTLKPLLEMSAPPRGRCQEWQIQLTIKTGVLREDGPTDSFQLPCNSKWQLKHPTVSMVEVLLSDKSPRVRDACSPDRPLVCQVVKLEEAVCKVETIRTLFPNLR